VGLARTTERPGEESFSYRYILDKSYTTYRTARYQGTSQRSRSNRFAVPVPVRSGLLGQKGSHGRALARTCARGIARKFRNFGNFLLTVNRIRNLSDSLQFYLSFISFSFPTAFEVRDLSKTAFEFCSFATHPSHCIASAVDYILLSLFLSPCQKIPLTFFRILLRRSSR
jgi:hypothetical protein